MTKVIGLRVTDEDYELIRIICDARSEDISSFARRAILLQLSMLGYLPEDRIKALGITVKKETQP